MEYLLGMIEKNIKEIGRMVNSMEKGNFFFLLSKNGKKEFGKMEKELDGLNDIYIFNI